MAYFRMELESLSENEEFARVVVAVFMSRMNPTLEQVDDVKTAVSEAVTNAVIHGYPNREGIILLEGKIEGDWLTVTVEDRGVGIRDVKRAMEPLYTTDRTGERSGMGFSFMETFMDEVQVESEQGKGTLVRMRKEIRQEREERGEESEANLAGRRPEPGAIPVTIQKGAASLEGMPVTSRRDVASPGSRGGSARMEETACTLQPETQWAAARLVPTARPVSGPEVLEKSPGTGSPGNKSRTAQVIQAILSVQP